MAIVFRRPASWKAPLAIVVAVVALLAVAAVLAFTAIRDNADNEVGLALPAVHQVETAGHTAPT